MFCYQCEQTARGSGCTNFGVCGKDPDTAALQDLLVHLAKEISQYAYRASKLGAREREIDVFVIEALFTTVTNVNFDPERLYTLIAKAAEIKKRAEKLYKDACAAKGLEPETVKSPVQVNISGDKRDLVNLAESVSIEKDIASGGQDAGALRWLLVFGLKGAASYADHAQILGYENPEIYAEFHRLMSFLAEKPEDIGTLVSENLNCGKLNLKVMEILDSANTGVYGHPEPTQVRITPVKGKAILISGHDLKDLEELLKQTEGKGINVYTHGEMLPANAYPKLKKFKHLVGNYGGAWQDQRKEFDAFPGAILMTTNCIQKPQENYFSRIFTSGLVAWPGVTHISDGNFAPVIKAALEAPGFASDSPEQKITIGFGHDSVMKVAGQVIEAVKAGKIRRFFLIGGCDGAKSGRNYFTELAQKVPSDCVILTLACGKYRFNKLEFGDIGGIPRLLDIGQCNDAYSAIQIAVALAGAFKCGVNDLPLSMILSWYEQKAVAILLTLLSLGVKNIRLGPTLPAFVTANVLKVLVDKFNIMPISSADEDLKAILG